MASRNSAKHRSAAQLAAPDVIAEEQTPCGVSCSVEAPNGLVFPSNHLSVGVDFWSTEGGGDATLKREGIEKTPSILLENYLSTICQFLGDN